MLAQAISRTSVAVASVQKTGQKLPQFKTGTNISRTKTFVKIEPKTEQFRTPPQH
jgi:hypothetical protein